MILGLETGFLVAVELLEHPEHTAARHTLESLVATEDRIAIAPQILAEFIRIATDSRRFSQPLNRDQAWAIAEQWWTAQKVVHVFPNPEAVQRFLTWLHQFSLGRKRLLDTFLAATYDQSGIQTLLTTNPADFSLFGVLTCITPGT